MSVAGDVWELVRQRANCACEYCGVREIDTGGLLTVDHFQPSSREGSDEPDNLIYCCARCNLYKADFWPRDDKSVGLWNPRLESRETHFLLLSDGRLHPITLVGAFTISRLRLNRPALVHHRRRVSAQFEKDQLLERCRDLLELLQSLRQQQARLLEEHRALLEEQRHLLRGLLKQEETDG